MVGDIVASLLGLVAVALTARALGPETFGLLVLLQTYINIVNALVNTQSDYAVIKFGADALEEDGRSTFERLLKLGLAVDFGTAVLGTALAIAAAGVIGQWLEWSPLTVQLARLYAIAILVDLTGVSQGVLRLFDAFGALAWTPVAATVVRVVAVGAAYVLDQGLVVFVLIWLASEVVRRLFLLGAAYRELLRRGITARDILRSSARRVFEETEGLFSFMVSTNLHGSLRLAARELDIMLVGGILDSSAAGLFKVAKKFGDVLNKVSAPLSQALYPELARLWTRERVNGFRRLLRRSSLVAGSLATLAWLGYFLLGRTLLRLTVGPEYLEAYAVLVWYALAVLLSTFSCGLRPALLSIGRSTLSFYIVLTGTVVYLGTMVPLLPAVGVVGAGMAYVLYYLVLGSGHLFFIHRSLRRRHAQA